MCVCPQKTVVKPRLWSKKESSDSVTYFTTCDSVLHLSRMSFFMYKRCLIIQYLRYLRVVVRVKWTNYM